MSDNLDTVVGYVVDVQGDLLTATLVEDEQGLVPKVTIGDEDILVGQLGSYLLSGKRCTPDLHRNSND